MARSMSVLRILKACSPDHRKVRTHSDVQTRRVETARRMAGPMARRVIERRLAEVGNRLQRLRSDLAVAEEQLAHFEEEADEARVRALVSETAIADRDRRGAERHAASMTRHRDGLREEIQRLETAQDELLDRFTAGG